MKKRVIIDTMFEEKVLIKYDDIEIPGIYVYPEKDSIIPVPAVLLLHGMLSNKNGDGLLLSRISERLALNGYASLRIDFCSCGENKRSRKEYNLDTLIEEAKIAYEHLYSNERIDSSRIGIIGHSLGGMVGFKVADLNPWFITSLNGAMISNIAESFMDIQDDLIEDINGDKYYILHTSDGRDEMLYESFYLCDSLSDNVYPEYDGNALICIGKDDQRILPEWGISFYNSLKTANKKLILIDKANHTFNAKTGDYSVLDNTISQILDYLDEITKKDKEPYKNIKVIAADIDGTITRTDRSTSKVNIEVIKEARKKYKFGLASGRPLQDIIDKYKEWGLDKQFDFLIGWNGCQLYDLQTDKTYEFNFISKEEIKEIIEFMSQFDCNINMYDGNDYLASKQTDKAWFSAFKTKRQFILAKDTSEFYRHDNGGIMFRMDPSLMESVEAKIEAELSNKNYVGFKTQNDLMEFSHANCSKGEGLKKYCEISGYSLDECISFGDTTNDNKMLECSLGVCMKNGSDDTKAYADVISEVECDEDGFAYFLCKHLL